MKKKNVLFLCTGNSIRSQMAEAFLRLYGDDKVTVYSAGVSPYMVHPLTVYMLEEEGIDVSNYYSKGLDKIPIEEIDFVITLCDHAQATCPVGLLDKPNEHWPIADPISFAGSEAIKIAKFREAKEEIRKRVKDWLLRFYGT